MARFGGTLIEEAPTAGGRFGGVAITEPETPEDKGFVERVEERRQARIGEVTQTFEDYGKGEIGFPQAAVQVLGKAAAGGTLDLIGEGLISTARGISSVVPDEIEEPVIEAAKETWNWIKESGAGELAGEAIEGGMEKWNEFKGENPNAAKTIESVANVGMLVAPVKVKARAEPSRIGKVGEAVEKSAQRTIRRGRRNFIGELITPEKSKKVLIAETARTAEVGRGPFKKSVVELSPQERAIAAEVKRIPEVTPKKTIQGNLNAIRDANIKLAKSLDLKARRSKAIIARNEVSRNIDDAVETLVRENPVVVGNAEITARRVSTKAKEIVNSHPGTPKGLLDARKELDSWIRSQKGEKAFDPVMENALSAAVRTVRTTMNDTVAKHMPTARVKAELKRQNVLFDAIENIGPKAAKESNSAVLRAWENTARALPFRGEANQKLALLFGMGGLGAAATFAPWLTGAAASVAGFSLIKKGVMSPNTRKGLAQLIKLTDRALLSSKNPSMIKQLRADRALIIELMKTAEEEQ